MIFVDTGAWYAMFVPSDPDHGAATAWYLRNRGTLVTTDYVIDELLMLMRARGQYLRALKVGADMVGELFCDIDWITPDDLRQAWVVFSKFQDKAWSFTDRVSRVVMERLGIEMAFAFDEHFRQFGTVTVVP